MRFYNTADGHQFCRKSDGTVIGYPDPGQPATTFSSVEEMRQHAEIVEEVNSVFEHKGGHIRNEDGILHNISFSEPPGWYFWFTDMNGYTDLLGPYSSEEDAEFSEEQLEDNWGDGAE